MKNRLFQILAAAVILGLAQMSCVSYNDLISSQSSTPSASSNAVTQVPQNTAVQLVFRLAANP